MFVEPNNSRVSVFNLPYYYNEKGSFGTFIYAGRLNVKFAISICLNNICDTSKLTLYIDR